MDEWRVQKFSVGQVVSGVVSAVMPFGVFALLDYGAAGFIPIPELSWRRIKDVGDVVEAGMVISAKVLAIDSDRAHPQVRLSLKAMHEDPFPELISMVGETVTGPVTKTTAIGVFVRIEDRPDGYEGLLPLADLEAEGAGESADLPAEGEFVRVRVVDVDLPHHRILLAPVASAMPWKRSR